MKKQWLTFLAVVIAVYFLVGRGLGIKYRISQDLQLDLFWGNTTFYFDNHDSLWHNDGATVAVIQFKGQAAEVMHEQLSGSIVWEACPMPDRMYEIVYEKSHTWATPSTFVEMAGLPEIRNSYWFFVDQDKYRNGTLVYGDSALEKLLLRNFSGILTLEVPGAYALALYDLDTDTLYYFQRNL